MADTRPGGFAFVVQNPNEKFSRETRTVIRKQAMRAIGATRRKPDRHFSSGSCFTNISNRPTRPESRLPPLLRPMPLSGLELLVKDCGLDPMDLSALTSIHVGGIASKILSSVPDRLRGVLLCRQRSYFSFVPTRLGHALVLDDAFRCLITIAHSLLLPDHKDDRLIFSNYGKALHSLQTAVNDPKSMYSAEVLCATAMLALFELLNSPNAQSWSRHIAGASRLIQLRGPLRFTSEFEKSVFISLSYPICMEAVLNNEACFLGDPAWVDVFHAATVPCEVFTDRSELGIELMLVKFRLPGLTKKTNHAVVVQDTLLPEDFQRIAAELRVVRSGVITWRRKFNTAVLHAIERPQGDTADFAKRYELLGVSLVLNILASRLLFSLVPDGRVLLEDEVQNLALELKAVHDSVKHNKRADFFLTQKTKVADAALLTHGDFEAVVDSTRVVEKWRLQKFFEAIGKKTCDGRTCCNINR